MLAGIGPATALPAFTGPTSAYYLDAYGQTQSTIYVVQGTSVINSFTTSYNPSNYAEANFAVSNVVTTNGFGSGNGSLGTAGQYSLTGTSTGVSHTAQATPSYSNEYTFDGTSDGTHNYTVQYGATPGGGGAVIQTDANWQNPIVLFSVAGGGAYLGIAYDSRNNSLWLSGYGVTTIADYSLSGTPLSFFDTFQSGNTALGYDAADDTLWVILGGGSTLNQFSTAGALLQQGTPTGLPNGNFFAGDFATPAPEPASMLLLGAGLAGLGLVRRRRAL